MSKKGFKGFFKRKKKTDDDTAKVPMKKRTVIIIEICVVVVLAISLIGIKYLITNKNANNTVKLENQVVNNITFSDFILTYANEKSDVKVTLINYTEENISVNKLVINLYASDNTQVSEITMDYLYSMKEALVLGPNQETTVENVIDLDLTDISKVEYVIE